MSDHLISATRELPSEQVGLTINLGENTTGTGDTDFYYASIRGVKGEAETIHYTPQLVIKERWLRIPNEKSFREVYEDGRLRKRVHYSYRQVDGGTQSFIERAETFLLFLEVV